MQNKYIYHVLSNDNRNKHIKMTKLLILKKKMTKKMRCILKYLHNSFGKQIHSKLFAVAFEIDFENGYISLFYNIES